MNYHFWNKSLNYIIQALYYIIYIIQAFRPAVSKTVWISLQMMPIPCLVSFLPWPMVHALLDCQLDPTAIQTWFNGQKRVFTPAGILISISIFDGQWLVHWSPSRLKLDTKLSHFKRLTCIFDIERNFKFSIILIRRLTLILILL